MKISSMSIIKATNVFHEDALACSVSKVCFGNKKLVFKQHIYLDKWVWASITSLVTCRNTLRSSRLFYWQWMTTSTGCIISRYVHIIVVINLELLCKTHFLGFWFWKRLFEFVSLVEFCLLMLPTLRLVLSYNSKYLISFYDLKCKLPSVEIKIICHHFRVYFINQIHIL